MKKFRAVVTDGVDKGRRFESEGARAVIGTHESAELRLTDATVSRFHCELRIEDGQPFVRDLGSRNGTRVDGVPVIEAPLRTKATLAIGGTRLRFEVRNEDNEIPLADRARFGRLVGESAASRALFAHLERAAASDANVLLVGETGCGKDAAAEAIHLESERRDGPFVVIDCAALPPRFADSALFGHAAGAVPGATRDRVGAFELADGGTLFLDEIAGLPLAVQPALLRAVERRELTRLGARASKRIDVRIIAASRGDLREAVNAGTFRPDLFWRLAVLIVNVPPLRDRIDDLPVLVEVLLDEMHLAAHPGAEAVRTRAFLAELARQPWHGNVRELGNYLERYLTLPPTAPTAARDRIAPPTDPWALPYRDAVAAWERAYLDGLLRASDNVASAARQAGIDRVTLYRMLWRHGLK